MTGLTIGIDPGKHGAIAFLDGHGQLVEVVDMPDATGAALGALIRDHIADWAPSEVTAAYVEKVRSRPGQGHMNVWTFAEGYGAVLGALGALAIPVHHVTTAEWRKTQRIIVPASTPAKERRKVGKTLGRQRAMELYADQAATFARAKDDGRAEAVLIARHGLGLS